MNLSKTNIWIKSFNDMAQSKSKFVGFLVGPIKANICVHLFE